MINRIEQMMKASGVEKQEIIGCCTTQEYFECQDKHNCANCDKCRDIEYPQFTPAKQLKLIKLIAKANEAACFYYAKRKRNHSLLCLTNSTGFVESIKFSSQNFETALAGLVLRMLKKNELDKAEVKRILER